jgi:hypothetical protein
MTETCYHAWLLLLFLLRWSLANFLPRLAWNHNPLNFHLLSN